MKVVNDLTVKQAALSLTTISRAQRAVKCLFQRSAEQRQQWRSLYFLSLASVLDYPSTLEVTSGHRRSPLDTDLQNQWMEHRKRALTGWLRVITCLEQHQFFEKHYQKKQTWQCLFSYKANKICWKSFYMWNGDPDAKLKLGSESFSLLYFATTVLKPNSARRNNLLLHTKKLLVNIHF